MFVYGMLPRRMEQVEEAHGSNEGLKNGLGDACLPWPFRQKGLPRLATPVCEGA